MKKKISLIKLSKNQLDEVKAGAAQEQCGCSCYYEGRCGSNTTDNADANTELGVSSVRPPDDCFYFCPGTARCTILNPELA